MAIIISLKVRKKLSKKDPPVTEQEIVECFENRTKRALIDNRQRHKTKPPTRWFIAETDSGWKLKVVFITYPYGMAIMS